MIQSCPGWILFDIVNRTIELRFAAKKMVVVLALSKGAIDRCEFPG